MIVRKALVSLKIEKSFLLVDALIKVISFLNFIIPNTIPFLSNQACVIKVHGKSGL